MNEVMKMSQDREAWREFVVASQPSDCRDGERHLCW